MLYLFGPKETDFVNGDSDLIHNTYDEVVERAKGFYLKFKMTLDKDEQYKKVKKEMIISAYTPDGWNQFRVFDIYNYSNHVEVVATQLHYDLNYKKVYPFNARNVTAQRALNLFVEKFKSDLPNFKFTSSIDVTRNFSTDDDLERLDEGHNALEILNRMAVRWGGELDVNGYNVRLVPKLGKFTNALLYEHKNISEFVDETSMSEVITRIHAVTRFRPERVEGSEDEPEEVTIQVVVDSPLINEYAQVYEEDYTNNDARTKAELVAWARLKYSTNSVDKPARSIKVETNIIDGQEINYGDDLVLKYTKHDVDEIIRCVGYQYNPNSKQYISVTLGSNTKTLSTTITGAVHDSTRNQFSNIEKQVQAVRYAANDRNRATTGPLPVPNPIDGDIWFYHPEGRPNEVELRIFQNGGWETIVNDMTGENIRKTIEAVELEAEGLAEEIAASDQKAAAALAEAGISSDLAQTARDLAATAKTNAADALAEASEAKTQAGKAVADALTAMSDARSAQTDSQTAIRNAATAHTDAQTAMSDAQSALSKASGAESSVSTLSTEVDTVAGKVALKADQTEVDTVKGTVATHATEISQNSTDIASKADKTVVDKISGTVSNQGTLITQNATAITSKAAQTEVDTVKGTVSTHTSTLSQHAKDISARLTQSQVDNLVNNKGYSTVSYVDTEISTTAGAIRTEMTAVEGKIPTEIGGRNLIVRSNEHTNRWLMGNEVYPQTSASPTESSVMHLLIPVIPGEVYTLTKNPGAGDNYWRISLLDENYAFVDRIASNQNRLTITIANGVSFAWASYPTESQPKMEKGSVATDWTPAPEDMLQQNDFNVFKAEYDQSAKGWSAKLSQIEKADYATKTWSNQTFATPQSITTTLKSYAKTTDLNGLATESYVGTQIKATTDAISQSLTEVKGITDNMLPPNLVLRYNERDDTIIDIDGMYGNWKGHSALKNPLRVNHGETYALSQIIADPNSPYDNFMRWAWLDAQLNTLNRTISDKESLVISAPVGASFLRFSYNTSNRVKVEKGSVSTNWVPNQQDATDIIRFTELKQDLDGFKLTAQSTYETKTKVAAVELKADKLIGKVGASGEKIAQMVMTDSLFSTKVLDVAVTNDTNLLVRKGERVRNIVDSSGDYAYETLYAYADHAGLLSAIRVGAISQVTFSQIIEDESADNYFRYSFLNSGAVTTILRAANQGTSFTVNVPSGAVFLRVSYNTKNRPKIQAGSVATPYSPAPEDAAIQSEVTQLASSWALSLKSGDDIKTQINATTSGIRLQGKTISLDGNTTMNNAFARSLMVDKLVAADVTAFTAKFHTVIANNIDVNNISGTKSTFLESAWTGLNSRAYIDSRRIRIESGTQGAYVELNNIPEFRSQYHDGTGVVMAKGRVQFFEPNGGSQGYMGRDIHTGTNDFGIFISRGKGWRLARATDKSSSTGDKYYTVKSGATDRVGIIEDMVRRRILPDGNTQNFINNSNKIARLNGWPILPQPWPTQRVGDQILYEKGKVVNEGSTGVSYEDIINFGKNGALTDWWLYLRQHVRFEAGYTSASDRRIKHNIQSTDIVALEEIESLNMVQFNMNSDGRYVPLGLIAQESGILRVPDEKNEGINVELATMLSLKGVQELYQRIKELEEEVKTLKENDA